MNGVEILAVEQVGTVFKFGWTGFLVVVAIGLLITLVVGITIFLNTKDWTDLIKAVLIGVFISMIFGVTAGDLLNEPTEYTNQYKVTISDEVSMNEFMEKYEIIEQDGKIYTVRER